jgi:hypothetical protein
MKKTNGVSLAADKITASQRKALEPHKNNLNDVIRDAESDSRKVADLRKKEKSLEDEAASLHRAAAQFDRDAEIRLAATLKQIERVHEAIHEAESRAHDDKAVNFQIIDNAQELISQLSQATYEALLDQIGSALAPYYTSFNDARYAARNAPAVNDLVNCLLAHRISPNDSIERIFEVAKETLRKIDALLNGSTIWSYQGAKSEDSVAAA